MKTDKKSLEMEKKLKKIPYERMANVQIKFLENQNIINGIGPESYGKIVRWIMTKLFGAVQYKAHDVGFRQKIGFHKANRQLIDNSYLQIAANYVNICNDKWYKKLYRVPKYYITLPFKAWIISLAYTAVESPAGRRAYDNA